MNAYTMGEGCNDAREPAGKNPAEGILPNIPLLPCKDEVTQRGSLNRNRNVLEESFKLHRSILAKSTRKSMEKAGTCCSVCRARGDYVY